MKGNATDILSEITDCLRVLFLDSRSFNVITFRSLLVKFSRENEFGIFVGVSGLNAIQILACAS